MGPHDATVASSRPPAWLRDEIILACALVYENDWRWLNVNDRRVEELSVLLQRMPLHPPEVRGPKFRNANGVARKTTDIATRHPDYRGGRTNGSAVDREVLHDFLDRPDEMHQVAESIRAGVEAGTFDNLPIGAEDDHNGAEVPEGRLLVRRYFARERDPRLREKKIRAVLSRRGRLPCEGCGFDFEATYGERGARYIECHHAVPLHISGATTTRLSDLVLLCANCHRMIHRGAHWLTLEELKAHIQS